MKCREVQNKLIDYLDNELSAKETEQIREHLNKCSECRSLVLDLERSWVSLKEEKIPYQPFFYTRLKQKMESRKEKSTFASKYGKLILQPAMYFVILTLGIFIGIQLGQGIDSNDKKIVQSQEEEYLETYTENQYMMTTQLDSIEQYMLKVKNTNNNE